MPTSGICSTAAVAMVLIAPCLTLLVTDQLSITSGLSCTGSGPTCYCQPAGLTPRQRHSLQLSLSLPPRTEGFNKLPILVFFHGGGGRFILKTGDYTPYAEAATAAGFAFLEYDLATGDLMTPIQDAIELQFLPAILNWTAQLSDATGNPASGRLDTTRVAVAGHSRGGKLAALHYAHGDVQLFAAYLIDPVDCPCFAPCQSNCYPSALAAVAKANRPLAVSGADIRGCCNPRMGTPCSFTCQAACYAAAGNATCTGNSYQDFLEAAGSGSQGSTAAAGHLQFAALSSGTFGTLANIFCGRNSSIADEVSIATAADMMDWMTKALPHPKQ